uniref:EGF-like domain-containing protein n=1 Tax=Globisporangium ultimum (strain ATCC 200006 / CBS 805.95 / DAOM BR144) TaxID=431595 RepID=K3WKA3_GLOUD
MKTSVLVWSSALVLAAAARLTSGATTTNSSTPAYYCTTDDDCAAWENTVCIKVEMEDSISKCTPNTAKRPACRLGQFGLCPSYQDTERGYLNAQCIFVADDSVAPTTATTTARKLQAGTVKAAGSSSGASTVGSTTTTTTRAPLTVAPAEDETDTTTSGSGDSTSTSVGDSSGDSALSTTAQYASYKINNQTVYGIFKCADVSECDNLAADPSTCKPAKCGDAASMNQCNNQGTCTHTSKIDITARSCMCYKGFSGTKCEKTESGECDVDCGSGGDCVDGECVCKKGFDGKKYNGKQGKANARCTKCTNDLACQNSNTCNIETGTCDCAAGYTGTTCGGVDDNCVTKDCGTGSCQIGANDKAVCMCPICDPVCTECPTKNCSTCPSAASSVTISVGALLVSLVVALVMQ